MRKRKVGGLRMKHHGDPTELRERAMHYQRQALRALDNATALLRLADKRERDGLRALAGPASDEDAEAELAEVDRRRALERGRRDLHPFALKGRVR